MSLHSDVRSTCILLEPNFDATNSFLTKRAAQSNKKILKYDEKETEGMLSLAPHYTIIKQFNNDNNI